MIRASFAFLLLFSAHVLAQHGTATTGQYPNGYAGAIFTGKVTQATRDNVTLTYTNGSRSETFIGRFRDACDVPRADGSNKRMESSELPIGAIVRAYYMGVTKKVDGEKQKVNEIFAISFLEYNGVKVTQRAMFWCGSSVKVLKVFNDNPPVDPETVIKSPTF